MEGAAGPQDSWSQLEFPVSWGDMAPLPTWWRDLVEGWGDMLN